MVFRLQHFSMRALFIQKVVSTLFVVLKDTFASLSTTNKQISMLRKLLIMIIKT